MLLMVLVFSAKRFDSGSSVTAVNLLLLASNSAWYWTFD